MNTSTNLYEATIKIIAVRAVAIVMGALVIALIILIYASFHRDIQKARERIRVVSQIADTPCGPVEYAVAGDGPAVLVAHGAGGGFDQGLEVSKVLVHPRPCIQCCSVPRQTI